MSNAKVSVDVRVDANEKAAWQLEADAACVSVSELVRQRMSGAAPVASVKAPVALAAPTLTPGVRVNLDADELKPLRGWLALEDSDGEVDQEQLADWRAFAGESGIDFAELLARVVQYTNIQHL